MMKLYDFTKSNFNPVKHSFIVNCDDCSVVKFFTDEVSDKIIDDIEKNSDKLKISDDNGALYLSAYEMDVDNLSEENQNLIDTHIDFFLGDYFLTKLTVNQKFIIKYNSDLISGMPGHYDDCDYSLPINLNNDFEGGGTHFPLKRLKYKPQDYPKGSGILFKANTISSYHCALPVTKGTRYALVLKFDRRRSILKQIFKMLWLRMFELIFKRLKISK